MNSGLELGKEVEVRTEVEVDGGIQLNDSRMGSNIVEMNNGGQVKDRFGREMESNPKTESG